MIGGTGAQQMIYKVKRMGFMLPRARQSHPVWAMVAVVIVAALLEFTRAPNHDVAWTLTVGDLMHVGKHLYSDIIEVNPPLIFWLAAGVRACAGIVHAMPDTIYRVIILLLGLGSAVSVWRLTANPSLAIVLLVSGLILVGPDFGQRDILTAYLMAPYIALVATQRGDRWAWLIGVVAGIGFCLKPFYVTTWILLLPLNRLRLADMAVVVTGFAYIGAVAIFAPAYAALGRVLGPAYEIWLRVPWGERIGSPTILLGVFVTGCSVLSRGRSQAWAWPVGWAFALATLGCAFANVIQGKPFTYQQQPVLMLGAATAVALFAARRQLLPILAMTALVGIAARAVQLWQVGIHRDSRRASVERALADLSMPPKSVFLSEFLSHGPPAFRALACPWNLSMPSLWWLTLPAGDIDSAGRRMLTARVAADIESADMVIVDVATRGLTLGAPPFPMRVTGDSTIAAALAKFSRGEDGNASFIVYRRRQ